MAAALVAGAAVAIGAGLSLSRCQTKNTAALNPRMRKIFMSLIEAPFRPKPHNFRRQSRTSERLPKITLDDGSPTYTPPANFIDNTLVANTVVVGGLIDITTTVLPAEGNTATIAVSGTYSAEAGQKFSVA